MPIFSRQFSFYLLTSALALAQTSSAPAGDQIDHDQPVALETFVVTGNPDARAAFDLAQGTSVLSGHQLHLNLTDHPRRNPRSDSRRQRDLLWPRSQSSDHSRPRR